ncbi:hypothetical protein [Nocardia neocaledoniensis]|uniref:hypothetical protein n=1 Tax=Nocardia neocaledoniensis TaxID=236511 RepID=UPI002456EB76|nr:hypothetical protein [Nocardia neocaledoniensis]
MPTLSDDPGNSAPPPRFEPECRLVNESSRYSSKVVRDLRYDRDLTIAIQGPGFSYAKVVFRRPAGFRVLDEGDLTEYWNTYSEPNGWLWDVLRGGWLDLERHRPNFFTGDREDLREYFLVDEDCINVLAWGPPEIIDLGTDPTTAPT